MKLVWKIFMTVIIVLTCTAGAGAMGDLFSAIFGNEDPDWWEIVVAVLLVFPGWYMWKGTKLIPIIFNIIVRIIIMISLLFIFPMLAGIDVVQFEILGFQYNLFSAISVVGILFFSLWGLWIKS